MVDDHPVVLDGYELLIRRHGPNHNFNLERALSCRQALSQLRKRSKNYFDIVILDIRLPISKDNPDVGGHELGLKIRAMFQTKIIVVTSISNPTRLRNINSTIKPDGFLTKSEVNDQVLFESIVTVLNGNFFYGHKIKTINTMNSPAKGEQNINLDIHDLKILGLIAQGEKMKNMPKYLPLSMSSVERRKSKIKDFFGLTGKSSDRELLSEAKRLGYL